ncbi:MAG: hypothetical protein D6704_03525 [Nitrospirae bacterium]|nr:MAG: hypothetical protein D6704_03525 [Nitrospirota bacterium]
MSIFASQQRIRILKVLVGSHAHGLARPESDQDFRSVFILPTEAFFHLDFKYPTMSWRHNTGDETAWEIAQFLSLALQCHPLILETFLAPVIVATQWGMELRRLFPAVWSPEKAYTSFLGYAVNQRTKFLEKKDGRPAKYAIAYLRVLANLCELLERRTFTIRIRETSLGDTLARIQAGAYRPGEVIDLGEDLTLKATALLPHCTHSPDRDAVDAFLVRVRRAFLDPPAP